MMHHPTIIAVMLVAQGMIGPANGSFGTLTTTSTTTVTTTVLTTLTGALFNNGKEHHKSHGGQKDIDEPMPGMHIDPAETGSGIGLAVKPAASFHATNHGNTAYSSAASIKDVCFPDITDKQAALAYPCNAAYSILIECTYGPQSPMALGRGSGNMGPDAKAKQQSNSTQRLCACDSHLFHEWMGCAACFEAHGSHMVDDGYVEKVSSSYCAASGTPTEALRVVAMPLVRGIRHGNLGAPAMGVNKDPLSGSTAVSLYFTPPVTGSAAWQVPEITNSAGKTTLSLSTSEGQLVQAAFAYGTGVRSSNSNQNGTISGHGAPTSTPGSGESDSGASATGVGGAAIAVVVGLAALVAMV